MTLDHYRSAPHHEARKHQEVSRLQADKMLATIKPYDVTANDPKSAALRTTVVFAYRLLPVWEKCSATRWRMRW